MSRAKSSAKLRRRHAPAQNSEYKTGDTQRKKHSLSRKKRRRILRGTLFIFFVVAIFVSLVLGLSQVFCKVDTVTVEYTNKAQSSKRFYTDKEIKLNSLIENGDNLLFISSADVSRKLEKNLPYISAATVKKDFPSGIIIELTECKKVYSYKAETGYYLADENGKFIELADGKKAKKYTEVICSKVTDDAVGKQIKIGKR